LATQAFRQEVSGNKALKEQRKELLNALAQALKFRPEGVRRLSPEKVQHYLRQYCRDVLYPADWNLLFRCFYVGHRGPLMAAFLDQLEIPHDGGGVIERRGGATGHEPHPGRGTGGCCPIRCRDRSPLFERILDQVHDGNRPDLRTDLGLIASGFRSLERVRLPEDAAERNSMRAALSRGEAHSRAAVATYGERAINACYALAVKDCMRFSGSAAAHHCRRGP
jgi:hypothetical protein